MQFFKKTRMQLLIMCYFLRWFEAAVEHPLIIFGLDILNISAYVI